MKNIKDEFLKDVMEINTSGLKRARINFHRFDNSSRDKDIEVTLRGNYSDLDYEIFLHIIDIDYDDEPGGKDNVNGLVIMKDGTLLCKNTFSDNRSWVNLMPVLDGKI